MEQTARIGLSFLCIISLPVLIATGVFMGICEGIWSGILGSFKECKIMLNEVWKKDD